MLLKDPDEEGALGRTHATSVRDIDRRAGTIILTTFKGDSDPEGKITSLQKMLKERDATILQLRDEIAGKKVNYTAALHANNNNIKHSFLGYRGSY